jgi:Putative peptidoglycan binding domain
MAEFSARRVVAVAAVAGALVGGAVAGGVAVASISDNRDPASASAPTGGSLATAAVVRTTLTNVVQVGGSIGFDGSYTITVPSGTSAQQVAMAEQAVTKDQQALSADQQAESDAAGADDQAISAAQTSVNAARSTLTGDQAHQTADCAERGASSAACSADAQKISQDQAQLTQAGQQLATAQSSATRDHDQNQAKVASDNTQLADDQSTFATLGATAENPGTTYTWLPKVGDIIKQGQRVYSLSNQTVPLLYGSIAAYRAFYRGMSDGADVGQLTHDLIALGYGAGLTQSNHYSAATVAAVQRWQTAVGLAATGEILLGQVVFEPGPIRVTSVTPTVGASAGGGGSSGGGGTVLTATHTTPVVTVDLDVSQEYLVKPGDAVSVVLPDGTTMVGGHIETVGNVATCPGGGSNGTGDGSSSADQSPCESAGSGNSSTPTVTVTVSLDATPPGATLDQAPVNVNITTQTADNVLAVPVNALLALAGGGFGVEVVTGNTSRLVGVTTGLYDNTLVQVSGTGLTVGTRVQVPSS